MAGVLAGLPWAANANTVVVLPGALWSGFLSTPTFPPHVDIVTPITGPGSASVGLGNSIAAVAALPTPSPSLDVRAGGTDLAQISGGRAHVALTYSIEIVGPGSGLAPLAWTGAGGVDSFNGGVGGVSLEIVTPGLEAFTAITSTNGKITGLDPEGIVGGDPLFALGFDPSSFKIKETVLFPINTILTVQMIAIADSDFELGPSWASAFIDPVFSIDPSFLNADQYSILTSPGIGNGADIGVPEPSTWVMMLLGFAGMGAVARRRPSRAILNAG